MKNDSLDQIILALKSSFPDAEEGNLAPSTQFQHIPGFDSMAVVVFQAELSKTLGDKAFEITPMLEMTIGEYCELLT